MRSRNGYMRRKCRTYQHFCSVDVLEDWAAWRQRQLEMELWCRERVGADGFAKQGRMGAERNSLEFRFKAPEIADQFQSTFGGRVGAEQSASVK